MATKKNSNKKKTTAARKRSTASKPAVDVESKIEAAAAAASTVAVSAKPALASVPDAIAGVVTAKVKPELVRAALSEVGLSATGPITDLIPELMKYYKGQYTEDEWMMCDVCGGLSVEDDDSCPFCGDTDVIAESLDKPDKLVLTNVNKKNKKPKKDAVARPATGDSKPNKQPRPEMPATLITAPLDEETRLARESFTTKDLASKEKTVQKCRLAFATNAYQLGKAIQDIHATDIWRVASDDNDRPFKNFHSYCEDRLNVNRTLAYDLMTCVANYDEKTALAIGSTTKLLEIHRAPSADRDELIEEAKKGLSVTELKRRVREAKKREASGPSASPTPPAKRLITCVAKPGAKTINMYKSKDRKKGDDDVRAVRISDEPIAMMEFENGTVMTMKIVEGKDGKLQAKLKFERP